MRNHKIRAGDPNVAELAEHMADAVTYLSRVAHKAGFDMISIDLFLISSRLRDVSGELTGCRDSKADRISDDSFRQKN
jgi:hypothetical protein